MHVVHVRADIVATKLGIILLLFFSSFHVLFSQKGFTYEFEFLHAFLSNKKIIFSQQKMGGPPIHPQNHNFRRTGGM